VTWSADTNTIYPIIILSDHDRADVTAAIAAGLQVIALAVAAERTT
jgi:hypothetical protein